ncbi:MAG: transposase [Ferruginibacter sp.]
MDRQHKPLLADQFYHVYTRAIGNEKLFLSNENYRYFLSKIKHHLLPVVDVFAYSLLPNHFHLLVRIKPMETLQVYFKNKKSKTFNELVNDMPDFVMEQFSNWLNGYTKAFNKMYNRKGGLFVDYLKRSEALTDADISSFIFYIHKNAVHHGLTKQIGEWTYDSFQLILSEKPTSLLREGIIGWFGSKKSFIDFHQQPVEIKNCLLNESEE